jgi:hypothetical protein
VITKEQKEILDALERNYGEEFRKGGEQAIERYIMNFRPPDLRDFAMPPIRRLGAVLCQETEFRWR